MRVVPYFANGSIELRGFDACEVWTLLVSPLLNAVGELVAESKIGELMPKPFSMGR
jgi:hypothetical protein